MYTITGYSPGAFQAALLSGTYDLEVDPRPDDVWLFTDPAARQLYTQQGRLGQLEEDICTYVMFNGRWRPEELQFKRELNRLAREQVLLPKPAFGHLSPHPTIYIAIDEGVIHIDGEPHPFKIWDQVVFEPWLSRLYHPGLTGPLRIGRLDNIRTCYLSPEAFPQARDLRENDLALFDRILSYPRRK